MPPKGSKIKKPGDGTSTPQAPTLADSLSYSHISRPFKNPDYKKNLNRKVKSVKAILNADRERERVERERLKNEKMEIDGEEKKGTEDEVVFYTTIEAPPSILPQKRYCDITGLEGPYTDPSSSLRYHDKSIYEAIKGLTPAAQQAYLAARGQHPVVK